MALPDEISGASPTTGIAGALLAGVYDISRQVDVLFATYSKRVLPLDGFVFWLRTGEFTAKGMLHFNAEREQLEDETSSTGQVVFTTRDQLVLIDTVDTQTIVIGGDDGERYAFRGHGMFNEQAGLWHYIGSTWSASFDSQFIDDPGELNARTLIVSDSLPAWLALATYNPIWLVPPNPRITLYPSFLVADNIVPPFGAVHIEPSSIQGLQQSPWLSVAWEPLLNGYGNPVLDGNGDPVLTQATRHDQLVNETVRVTLYGCDNATALAFLDLVLSYSRDTDIIGMMDAPIAVRDEKRPYPEAMVIAQKKTIEFRVSYLQSAVYLVAQKMIRAAATSVATMNEY